MEQEMSPEEFVKRYNEMIKEDSKKHVEPMEPHEHIQEGFMDNLKYNKSHAPDPTAREAIMAADEVPEKIQTLIKVFKMLLKMNNLELAKRIQIRDKETGRIWK